MDFEFLIPLAPFLMVAAIVIVPAWLRTRDRREMQATVRAAIEKGQPLPPELVEALSKDVRPKMVSSSHRDMRIGVILLFVAGGVALTGVALGQINDNAMYGTLSGAAIPGMIGLAFVILSFFNPNKRPPQD
ncbi:hypothetical protein ASD21_18270 [Caulobacter sp. Root1455]|uniref:DUF6249 domain-containing protein n=1 Tax=unclassified Caulobacter TaxID=2648921 RepID=UPI0006FE4777|nr:MULTISPECIES: DUF6249 domain-containing protein [unclassified Caulobacter]KQY29780.1 hypothetical protein ASD38_10680 [Caulobacter sp. Root487D2Y]KQZ05930.1 hypothetical protein ASD21_18270 [Caulobacter sp. Root1455]